MHKAGGVRPDTIDTIRSFCPSGQIMLLTPPVPHLPSGALLGCTATCVKADNWKDAAWLPAHGNAEDAWSTLACRIGHLVPV
jgi:hypothetical protein